MILPFLFLSITATAEESRTREQIAQAMEAAVGQLGADLVDTRLGIALVDPNGQLIFSHNGDDYFNIASNAKVITIAAALALFGPEHRFTTRFYSVPPDNNQVIRGPLWIRGGGDPSLVTGSLYEIARKIQRMGIRKITGGIAIDERAFDHATTPPHFDEQDWELAAYRAEISPASFNYNGVTWEIRPTTPGFPAKINTPIGKHYFKINAQVQTVARGRTWVKFDAEPKGNKLHVTITGKIRVERNAYKYRMRIPDPGRYLAEVTWELLRERGVSVPHKISKGHLPSNNEILLTHGSPPLSQLVRSMGKYSSNFVAEMMVKNIGALVSDKPATWEDGLETIRDFLANDLGITTPFVFENGSGLYSSTSFTPQQITTVLHRAGVDPRYRPEMLSALSIAGADGTLWRRMKDPPLLQILRAKTGTLASVSTLAGYFSLDGQGLYSFAIFCNEVPAGKASVAREYQDQFALALYEFANATP